MTEATVTDDVAIVRIDNGKVNALSPAVVQTLADALEEAEGSGRAVVLCGRPGYLSAGFDLEVMRGAPEGRDALVAAGRDLLLRIFAFERPVVVACTGHAIAAGAGLLVAADFRVGARGTFRLGFNEAAIGHALSGPTFEMIRYRMPPNLFESVVRGELFGPDDAVGAGLLDQVVEPDEVEAAAVEVAQRLGALDRTTFATMKQRARGPALEAVRRAVDEENR